MAVTMTANTSDLYAHGRTDPEYYLPSHIEVENTLNHVRTVPLNQLGHFSCSAFYPAATHLYTDNGIPFLRCVDIIDYPVLSNDQPFARIPEDFVLHHGSIRSLTAGDIIISKVGTPCYAGLLSESMPKSAMTRTVIGMSEIKTEVVNPYYLIAFLRSKYGFDQLMRQRELTIQYQLTLERTRKVRIFLPERDIQEEIGGNIESYYSLLRTAKDNYETAQHLFEAELGLDKLKFKKPVGYTARFSSVSLSQAFSARRVDAQCFAPSAMFYDQWLTKRGDCERLASLLSSVTKGGHQQDEVVNGTADYCSIKHISGRELVDVSKCIPDAGTQFADKDDLLLAITGATIGKIGIVQRYSRLAFSGDLLRLRVKPGINPHYLLLALDHSLGQVQFNRWITGSTNGHLAPRDVGSVLVSRLKPNVETLIAELVEESLAQLLESERLLEQAKTRVEQLIEEAVKS